MIQSKENKKTPNNREGLPAGRQGLGMVEMVKMALYRPWAFYFTVLMIKCHMYGVAKRMLGIQ